MLQGAKLPNVKEEPLQEPRWKGTTIDGQAPIYLVTCGGMSCEAAHGPSRAPPGP